MFVVTPTEQAIAIYVSFAAPASIGEASPVAVCAAGSMCFELLKGMPTTIVALIVAGIAFRQYLVARAKLKLDLFEKRYAIFLETWTILSGTVIGGTLATPMGLATPFNNFMPQAAFLFGPEVATYLNKAAENWALLRGLQSRMQAGTATPAEIAQEIELQTWFFEQANKNVKKLFGKYLSFEKWH